MGGAIPAVRTSSAITIPVNTSDRYTIDFNLKYLQDMTLTLSSTSGSNVVSTNTYNHSIIRDNAGSQFDPKIVDVFLDLYSNGEIKS